VQDASDRAIAPYSGPRTSFGWPPDEYIVAIVLQEREWVWLLQQMDIWHVDENTNGLKQLLIDALGDPPLES
ncbi:MAG: hypothetical protein ACK5H2_06645, partial [Beutenbergiaceae bacterium]